jgi:hypothetical protein
VDHCAPRCGASFTRAFKGMNDEAQWNPLPLRPPRSEPAASGCGGLALATGTPVKDFGLGSNGDAFGRRSRMSNGRGVGPPSRVT